MKCYQRLAESTKTHESLKNCLPTILKDPPKNFIKD